MNQNAEAIKDRVDKYNFFPLKICKYKEKHHKKGKGQAST